MFLDEDIHRPIKGDKIVKTGQFGTFALVMNYLRIGNIINFPAGFLDPVAVVKIFTVHEECLIKPQYFLKYGPSEHQKGATDRIYLNQVIGIFIGKIVLSK